MAGIAGIGGVALLVLTLAASLDPASIAAGLTGAVSMAFGTVLTRHWQPPVPPLTFTAWQLTAGGVLLVPVALIVEPSLPLPTAPLGHLSPLVAVILGWALLGQDLGTLQMAGIMIVSGSVWLSQRALAD